MKKSISDFIEKGAEFQIFPHSAKAYVSGAFAGVASGVQFNELQTNRQFSVFSYLRKKGIKVDASWSKKLFVDGDKVYLIKPSKSHSILEAL